MDAYGGFDLTTHSSMSHHRTMGRESSMPSPPSDVTTIQVTTETRDRLYRLKFRRTYDAFLRELCDLYENSNDDGQK